MKTMNNLSPLKLRKYKAKGWSTTTITEIITFKEKPMGYEKKIAFEQHEAKGWSTTENKPVYGFFEEGWFFNLDNEIIDLQKKHSVIQLNTHCKYTDLKIGDQKLYEYDLVETTPDWFFFKKGTIIRYNGRWMVTNQKHRLECGTVKTKTTNMIFMVDLKQCVESDWIQTTDKNCLFESIKELSSIIKAS